MNVNDIISHPAFWVVVAAGSELIALSKLRDNSWIQLIFTMLRSIRPKRG